MRRLAGLAGWPGLVVWGEKKKEKKEARGISVKERDLRDFPVSRQL